MHIEIYISWNPNFPTFICVLTDRENNKLLNIIISLLLRICTVFLINNVIALSIHHLMQSTQQGKTINCVEKL